MQAFLPQYYLPIGTSSSNTNFFVQSTFEASTSLSWSITHLSFIISHDIVSLSGILRSFVSIDKHQMPKVTLKVNLHSCAPHLLHEDDPLDSLQHHEHWGVYLTTGFVQLLKAYVHRG